MSRIATAVRWRHGTFVLFCLLAVFGGIALSGLPLELQPGGDRPEITITTRYPGASPVEVENLVTRPIEERMEEVLGVREISSTSRAGGSSVTLEFVDGSRLSERMVDVLNQLQQVDNLPPEAGESNVEMVSGASSPMMWIMLAPKPGFQSDPNHYRDLVDNVILPRLRRVPGVGQFFTPGGQEREVEVRVDPKALAVRNLTIGDVARVLRDNNRDVRGGPMTLGRREYRVRTVSRSQDLAQLEQFVLRRDAAGAVYLRDVASVEFGRKPPDSVVVFRDQPTVAVGVIRQVGANVPEVARGVRAAIAELEEQFDRAGEGIDFVYNYDESEYVGQAVRLVWGNLLTGAALATLALVLFLGSLRTVAVVVVTIPVTLISVFSVMALLGRSLNIISLAGLAFSVGMIVDSAIVVIENVFTHLQRGKSAVRAAIDGTVEVWPALLGSTLTNVVVFIPLLLVTGEVGQLYADMAIALSAATLFALFAALTLVPMLAGLFLSPDEARQVQATINGQVWRFLLDVPSANRSFNSDRVTLKGRSRSAWLHNPYTPIRNFSQANAREMRQLGEAALENTGWTLDWQGANWVVPAGRYQLWNTPIGVLIRLANVTDDGVYTHPCLAVISLVKRWPVASWLVDGETASLAIPEAAILSLTQSPIYTQPYNGVYVSGTSHGALALVKIAGTDGALQPAEPLTDELLCDEAGVAARQRGLNVLSDSGAGWEMDAETLFAPNASPAFPLVPPGQIVSIAGLKGVSRSCRITAQWSGKALSVRQMVGLERREMEAA